MMRAGLFLVGFAAALGLVGLVLYLALRRFGVQMSSVVACLGWLLSMAMFWLIVPTYLRIFAEIDSALSFAGRILWGAWPAWALLCLVLAATTLFRHRLPLPGWLAPFLLVFPFVVFLFILSTIMFRAPTMGRLV